MNIIVENNYKAYIEDILSGLESGEDRTKVSRYCRIALENVERETRQKCVSAAYDLANTLNNSK